MQPFFLSKSRCIRVLVLLSGLILLSTYSFAAKNADTVNDYSGEYRVPLGSDPASLDPAMITDIYSMNVVANLFDGLVEFDNNLNVIPAIAKIWKVSRDHRTYSFRLQKGVKFHNGREVTAEDFVYSFTRILSPETKSPAASLFFNISGARAFREGTAKNVAGLRAKDAHTLIIELQEPFAPFLSILAMINAKVVPNEAVGLDFSKHPVGTGPFRFRSWQPGEEITLEANKDYFAGRPYLDMLRFRIYPNIEWEKVYKDFERGHLEQAFIPSGKFDAIAASHSPGADVKFISKPGLNVVYVAMNLNVDLFKDPKIRQAICYAVDSEKIVKKITRRNSFSAKGILPPGIPGFDPNLKYYPYDPQKARELLAEAGYPEGHGIPPIEIWTVSKSDSVKQELEAYRKYLSEIGIQAAIRVAKNWKDFVTQIKEKKATMYYAAWYADFPDPDNFLYTLFHSKSRTNRMGYNNPEVDELLEQARSELDYMKRVKKYQKIQDLVMQDAPMICQHVNSFNYVFQPWVNGVEMSHLGAIYLPFRKVSIGHRQFADGLLSRLKARSKTD